MPEVAWCLQERDAKGADSDTKPGHLIPEGGCFDIAHSLRAEGFDASEDGTGRGTPIVPSVYSPTDYAAGRYEERPVTTPVTASRDPSRATPLAVDGNTAPTLTAANDPSRSPQSEEVTRQIAAVHAATMRVRRLTPRECERLMGMKDDYTKIPWKGKPADLCPDGPRYRALGNSMAVPVVSWIGKRIQMVEEIA